MPANLQRFLPLLLIVFVLLFIVPAILHKKSSSTGSLTASELSTQTIGAMSIVDRTEGAFRTAHRSYSPHVADLLTLDHALGTALGNGVVVSLDVSSNGADLLRRGRKRRDRAGPVPHRRQAHPEALPRDQVELRRRLSVGEDRDDDEHRDHDHHLDERLSRPLAATATRQAPRPGAAAAS